MFSVLKPHRWKLALLLIAANLGLILHLACGELKSVSEWVWLDIIGEGGSALLALIWLGLVLKSRPAPWMARGGGPPNHWRITGTPSSSEVPSGGARAFCLLLGSFQK